MSTSKKLNQRDTESQDGAPKEAVAGVSRGVPYHRAVYRDRTAFLAAQNPLLAWMPPPPTRKQKRTEMSTETSKAESQRPTLTQAQAVEGDDAALRIELLPQYHEVLARDQRLEAEMDALLRAGYALRAAHFQFQHDRAAIRRQEFLRAMQDGTLPEGDPHQGGLALIGASGSGKSKAVVRILRRWPQVVMHELEEPGRPVIKQLVWLMIDAPPKKSVRALVLAILSAVDRALGTNYLKAGGGRGTEDLLLRLREVVDAHALGMIVIDELQTMKGRGVAVDDVVNTLVRLVNTLSVPLVVIGTPAALTVLQREIRLLRRLATTAHRWNPLPNGGSFKALAQGLVTRAMALPAEWSPTLQRALFEWTQGLPSLLVQLLVRSQRVAFRDGRRTVTREDLEDVAKSWPPAVQRMTRAIARQHALGSPSPESADGDDFGDVMFV